jgi:hypothetical protein
MPDGSLGFDPSTSLAPRRDTDGALRRRLAIGAVILAAAAAGALAASPTATLQAVSNAGAELTRLLRAMAMIKAAAGLGLAAAVVWRLAVPIPAWRLAAYAAACAAMAAGPGLIWSMAHLRLGALLLHAGLFATVLLLWRDPAMGARLEAIIAARRAKLAAADFQQAISE